MVKLLALLAMIIDHTNTVFLSPAWPVMYALGRMAFPLFMLIWAMNVQHTPERLQKRASRLWIWAVITQPVLSLAFSHHQPWWALNILFVFAGVTQLLALQYRHGRKGMLAGYLLLALMIWPLEPASYGLAGITLAISMATVSGSDTPGVQRLALRKEQTVPLMQSLYDWIQVQMKVLSRHSDTAKAFAYLVSSGMR